MLKDCTEVRSRMYVLGGFQAIRTASALGGAIVTCET